MTLAELREEIARREADLRRYRVRLDELVRENESVRATLDEHEAALRRQEATVRARLVTLCRLSRGGYLQLIAGASSWVDLLRRAQIVRAVVERDIETLASHQRQVEALADQRRELTERIETQRSLSDRISQYQQDLEAERERRVAAESSASPPPFGLDDLDPTMSEPGFDL
jgi:peptidoglycan hydrolase CwlO-like protein